MQRIDWYFDYVSPFSYLQFEHQLPRLPESVRLDYKPVLLAGLLQHHGQRGPAEIAAKRRFTYRHVQWLADRLGVPFRFPPAHPFNPLPLLRLALAAGAGREAVGRIFRFVWAEGRLPDAEGVAGLAAELGLEAEAIRDHAVKSALRENGETAVASGVFGVPSAVVDGEVFWGFDAFEFLAAYLADATLFTEPEMQRVVELPVAAERPR